MTRPTPLLVAGHGTVSERGVAEFLAFTARLRGLLASEGVDVGSGFIELSAPTVHDAWSELAGTGHRRMAAVPLVLVAAGHAKGDIPAALEREARRSTGTSFCYGRPLGPHPTLLRMLERHVEDVLDGQPRSDTAVLLVGRGSTDPDANAEVCKIARLLAEGRGYGFVETAFVSLTVPDVPAGLARCRALGARRVVVAPYFLFDGVLPQRVLAESAVFGAAHPDLDIRVASYLGDSDELAELVIERYREALDGDIRMNCDTCAYRALLPGFEDKLGADQMPHHHPQDGHPHGHSHVHADLRAEGPAPAAAPVEQHYLAGLDLDGRRVVVVGGGSVAQRRLPRLLTAGAEVELVAPSVTPAVEAMATSGELRWTARRYSDGDLTGAWYVLACTDDPSANAAVAAEALRDRVYCVRADDSAGGTAVTPAVGEYDGLVVGVLAGRRPRRSAAVRTALVEALRSGLVTDEAEPPAAGVALVGGGPGDPELITVRGRRLLSRADVVVTDRLAPRELLEELAAHVEVIDASKIPYGRAMNQAKINELLVGRAKAGKFVVRLKGGDPYVFGRGYEEVMACAAAGVAVMVVPGVTSAFAVPAMADVPVTHRGVAHEVVVVSGHVAPEDPRSLVDWPALGRLRGTLVLLMAVERIAAFAEVLLRNGRPADTPVAVVQDGTLRIQRSVRCTLAEVAAVVVEQEISPPAVVVIGPVAGLAE
jgi:uroporphyrin-III C-methyltransferase / precorrin-2 dehydrogenase / sirohydrochlorin ferrochelatase